MNSGLVSTSLNIAPFSKVRTLDCPQGAGLAVSTRMLCSRACPAAARSVQIQRYSWLLQDSKLSLPKVHRRRASRWSLSDPRVCRTGCACGVQDKFGTLQTARSVPTLASRIFALQPPAPVSLVSPKVAITNTSDGVLARALSLREHTGSATQVTRGRQASHTAQYF